MMGDFDLQRPWLLAVLLLIPLTFLVRRKLSKPVHMVRILEIVLLVAALAGPVFTARATTSTAIFVLDQSASVQSGSQNAAISWINDQAKSGTDETSAAVITFGAEPDLILPPTSSPLFSFESPATQGDSSTNISSALELAMAMPVGERRRIVLLSDGSENLGDASAVVERARQLGIPIDVVQLQGIDTNDLRVSSVTGPSAVWQGEPVSLLVTLGSGFADTVTMEILVDGAVVTTQQVEIAPGTTTLTITLPALPAGFHAIQVRVQGNPDLDGVIQNNSAPFAVVVRDQPQVLVVTPLGADPSRFVNALSTEGMAVSSVEPSQIPASLAELSGWDAIVLNNVPSWDLTYQQQDLLAEHTRSGHGLIVIGGSASYGPGSYAGTPLEDALPVSVKVTDGRQRPKVAVLIVMDKSGSMSYDPDAHGQSKLELAKDGVITAASALSSGDQIGVIAFNDRPVWALPMTELGAGDTIGWINSAIAPLTPDGGTEMYPALQLAYDSLRNTDADVKHIILLSDGRSQSGTLSSYTNLITDAQNEGISLSAVALGTDADLELLQQLASYGGGRYHFATEPNDIPQITFEEAKAAGSQSVLRGAFQPVQAQLSPVLNGIDISTLPTIDGYNFAEPKPGAQVDLMSDRRDPLLAKWQLGLGRVVAWTADDGSDFAGNWSVWSDYASFWGNVVRWSLPDPNDGVVRVVSSQEGSDTLLTFNANLDDGSVVPLTDVTARITDPSGEVSEQSLVVSGTGEWQTRMVSPESGAWKVELVDPQGVSVAPVSAVVVPQSPEYLPSPGGDALLEQIAAVTGGSVFTMDAPADGSIFHATGSEIAAPGSVREYWQWPLGAFLAVFLLELATRLGWFSGISPRSSL